MSFQFSISYPFQIPNPKGANVITDHGDDGCAPSAESEATQCAQREKDLKGNKLNLRNGKQNIKKSAEQ